MNKQASASGKVKMSGAEAIARAMKECGVEYFFYMSGGMPVPYFTDAIQNEGIKTILARNEKAATNMADGYARVTRKPTVCYGQYGAAAAMLASMLYEPMFAHSPVVALSGSFGTFARDQFAYQECYEMKYFEPTCKFNADVVDVNRLGEYMRTAVQIAVSGCPGPTHINMGIDMASATDEMPEILGASTFLTLPPFRPRAEPGRIAEAARLLVNAERPVLVCGSGIHWSDAYDEVKALAEMLTIPVITNPNGKGCFPEASPLWAGVMGNYGRPVSNEIVQEADVVFFVATRAGRHQTAGLQAPIPGASKIIHLDIDPVAIGRNYRPDVALMGDAKATLQDLLANLKTMIPNPKPKAERIDELARKIKAYETSVTREGTDMINSDAVPIMPQRVVNEVSKFIGPRDIVVSDTGNMLSHTSLFLKLKGIGKVFLPCGGTLGSSFAMAIGASFGAAKDQRIIHMTGDGGMGYNLCDIETSVRYNALHVPMVTVVHNNSVLAVPDRPFTHISYAKIFEDFGGCGIRVERAEEIASALQKALYSGKPSCVECITEPTARSRMGGA